MTNPNSLVEDMARAISETAYDNMRAQGFSGGWDHDEFGQAIAAKVVSVLKDRLTLDDRELVERLQLATGVPHQWLVQSTGERTSPDDKRLTYGDLSKAADRIIVRGGGADG